MGYKPFNMPESIWRWLKLQSERQSTPERRVSMADVLRDLVTDAEQREQAGDPIPAAVRND